MIEKEYIIAEKYINPLYFDIFSFEYIDMSDEEKKDFYTIVKDIANSSTIINDLKILVNAMNKSFIGDNWRTKVGVSWLSIVINNTDFQSYISQCLAEGGTHGSVVYIYALLEFNNENSIKALKNSIENDLNEKLYEDEISNVSYAEVALSMLNNEVDTTDEDFIFFQELQEEMKAIRKFIFE